MTPFITLLLVMAAYWLGRWDARRSPRVLAHSLYDQQNQSMAEQQMRAFAKSPAINHILTWPLADWQLEHMQPDVAADAGDGKQHA